MNRSDFLLGAGTGLLGLAGLKIPINPVQLKNISFGMEIEVASPEELSLATGRTFLGKDKYCEYLSQHRLTTGTFPLYFHPSGNWFRLGTHLKNQIEFAKQCINAPTTSLYPNSIFWFEVGYLNKKIDSWTIYCSEFDKWPFSWSKQIIIPNLS